MKISSLLYLICMTLIAGCSVPESVHQGDESMQFLQKPAELRNLYKQIEETDRLKSCHIDIVTLNKTILMIGQSPTEELRQLSEATLQKVHPDYHIINRIELGKKLRPDWQLYDTWLTTKARAQMLITSNLRDSRIKIATADRQIYLLGKITDSESTLATDIAQSIEGVTRVITFFDVETDDKQSTT